MTVTPGTDIEVIDLTQSVESFDLSCDYADDEHPWCPRQAAQWAAIVFCESCGYRSTRLLCTPCKDFVMDATGGAICIKCDDVTVPFRQAFAYIEPLDKKP